MKNLFFVSGMPRSGSTLLMNILGQNPNHYVSPTSGLCDYIIYMQTSWKSFVDFQAEGLDIVKPRINNLLKNSIFGYYENELKSKIVFDKSRSWLQHVELIESILGCKIKILVPVRDVRAVVASFEKLYRNREIDHINYLNKDFFNAQTIYGRTEILLNNNGIIGFSINKIRDAFIRVPDRLLIVPYNALVNNTQKVFDDIHEKLNLPKFDYDFNNIKQITHENDVVYGMNLHKIKSKIEPNDSWQNILPNDLIKKIEQSFKDFM